MEVRCSAQLHAAGGVFGGTGLASAASHLGRIARHHARRVGVSPGRLRHGSCVGAQPSRAHAVSLTSGRRPRTLEAHGASAR